MGNRLSLLEFYDIEDPSVDVELKFFRSLKLKWTKMFFARVAENMLSDFDINNEREMVSWKDFFRIFSEIKQQRDIDIDQKRRMMWHPAASGYMMNRDESVQELIKSIEAKKEKRPPDDWTDDDASDFDESEEDEEDDDEAEDEPEGGHKRPKSTYSRESGVSQSVASSEEDAASSSVARKKSVNPKLDCEIINPIFFGYSTDTVKEFEKKKAAEAENLKIAEERAVKRTKEARNTVLDGFEVSMKNQANVRLKKMAKLEQKYEASKAHKEKDLLVNKGELPPAAFRMFQVGYLAVVLSLYLQLTLFVSVTCKPANSRIRATYRLFLL